MKGARISDFGGKSLNAADDHAQIYPDFEHPESEKLRQWFGINSASNFEQVRCLTAKPQGRESGGDNVRQEKGGNSNNLNLIREISDSLQDENDVDQFHFFFLNGYVSRIKNDDRIYYPACQSENCRRKVIEDSTGYKCEHCGKTYGSYTPTYMITARISDFTDSIYVNFAREHGAALMGMKAEEFKEFKENKSEEEVQAYFDSLLFKPLNIMIKGKFEFFNGENRMRYFAVKVFPHNTGQENRALLKRLEIYKHAI